MNRKKMVYAAKKRFFFGVALPGLFLTIALLFLMGSDLMGQRRSDMPLPDFTVDTAQGKYTYSEHRGKILVYFFAFPG